MDMSLYSFDECILYDNKGHNSVRIQPQNVKVDYSKRYRIMFWDMPKIKDVIFNDPATIVFWADGTKTVVQCQDDDIFDPEKGLAMAISKKALGNKGNYCNEFRKWLPEDKEATLEYILNATTTSITDIEKSIVEEVNKRISQLEKEVNKNARSNTTVHE